jgi:CHRD domain
MGWRAKEALMSHSTSLTLISAVGIALAFTLTPAAAEVVKYKAALNGPSENPPTTSKGSGSIEADYDSATKTLTWSGTYADLTGPETAAHFHGPAAMGTNAGVMVPVEAKASPFKGSAVLTAEQAKAFADGLIYFNVHTAENKGGEIRGQLAPAK